MTKHEDELHLSSRLVRKHGQFTVLLVSLLALLIVPAISSATTFGGKILGAIFVVVALAAAFNVGHRKAALFFAVFMAVSVTVARGATFLWPDSSAGIAAAHVFAIGLFAITIWGVARAVFGAGSVTSETLRGAVCIYILLGVMWASVYSLIEAVQPGAFSLPALAEKSDETMVDVEREAISFQYYSFVTLTTLGYGDVTPKTPVARTLSWLEAVVGQLFIALTLARLVAIHVSQGLSGSRREKEDGTGPASKSGEG